MLRITREEEGPGGLRLRLEGRVTARELPALEAECRALREQNERFALDLSGVLYVDEPGALALAGLGAAGISVEGSTAYVRALLGEVSS